MGASAPFPRRRIAKAGFLPALALALAGIAVPAGADAQQPLLQAQAGGGDRLAGVIAEVDQLQEDLRQLRGRIEELEHARATDEARIGALEAQLEAQPQPRAGAPSAAAGSAAAPRMPAQLSSDAGAAPAPAARSGSQRSDARTGNILGTIPRAALLNQPSPSSEPAQAPAAAASGGTERERYDAAMGMLQAADWSGAQEAFQSFVHDYPKGSLAPNAAYWLGETYYVRKDYANAAATFARNYRTYGPDAPKSSDDLLKLGMSLAALGDKQKACETYAELQKRHPDAGIAVRQALVRERAAAGC
jgi:tol-pal system protein YbgF